MADVGEALQEALEALIDEEAGFIVGGSPPDWIEVLTDYTNSQIADAAGYRTKAGRRPRTGSQRWRDYRALMQDLGRYRRGVRHPTERQIARLERLGLELRRRELTPHSMAEVLRLIRRHGLTVTHFAGVVRISDDESYRVIDNVPCSPSHLARQGFHVSAERAATTDSPNDWIRAFEDLFRTWRESYGVPGFALVELDELELAVGRQPEMMGGHRADREEGAA